MDHASQTMDHITTAETSVVQHTTMNPFERFVCESLVQ